MKPFLLTILFTVGLGISAVIGQDVPTNADPTTQPTQTPEDQDPTNPNNSDIEFPVDVIDTTIDDTSDIEDISIDSSFHGESEDTVRNHLDNSGIKNEEEKE